MALSHFKALHTNATSANPNCLTYEFFLKACNRLLPEGETRSHLVIKALELCRQRGLVTAQVCREAYKCDSQVVLERLDATPNGGMEDIIVIPDGWCDHVPHSKQRNQTVALRSERDIEHA